MLFICQDDLSLSITSVFWLNKIKDVLHNFRFKIQQQAMQTEELEEKKCENANLKQVRFYCIVMFYREIHSFLYLPCPVFED